MVTEDKGATTTKRAVEGLGQTLLSVKELKMYFPVTSGLIFQHKVADVKAVDGVSFDIKRGETLGWWASPAAASRRRAAPSCSSTGRRPATWSSAARTSPRFAR